MVFDGHTHYSKSHFSVLQKMLRYDPAGALRFKSLDGLMMRMMMTVKPSEADNYSLCGSGD